MGKALQNIVKLGMYAMCIYSMLMVIDILAVIDVLVVDVSTTHILSLIFILIMLVVGSVQTIKGIADILDNTVKVVVFTVNDYIMLKKKFTEKEITESVIKYMVYREIVNCVDYYYNKIDLIKMTRLVNMSELNKCKFRFNIDLD